MPRPQQTPLRPLTAHERTTLEQVARSGAERADRVGRAKALLAVADGAALRRRRPRRRPPLRGRGGQAGGPLQRRRAGGPDEPRPAGGRRVRYGPARGRAHPARSPPPPGPGRGRHRHLVADHAATGAARAPRTGCPTVSTFTILPGAARGRVQLAGATAPGARPGWSSAGAKPGVVDGGRSGHRRKKGVIERAYRDRRGAGHPGLVPGRGRPVPGHPPAGAVLAAGGAAGPPPARVRPRRHRQAADAVPPGHRRGAGAAGGAGAERGAAPLAAAGTRRHPGRRCRRRTADARAARRPPGSGESDALLGPGELPPLRLLLVWDNLAGHQTPALVDWLVAHGVWPLFTPLGGSWLNLAESVQRILVRRALAGQHPQTRARR